MSIWQHPPPHTRVWLSSWSSVSWNFSEYSDHSAKAAECTENIENGGSGGNDQYSCHLHCPWESTSFAKAHEKKTPRAREKTCCTINLLPDPSLHLLSNYFWALCTIPSLGMSSCAPSYQPQQLCSCICLASLLPLLLLPLPWCLPHATPLYSLPSCPLWSFERYPELLPPVDLRLAPLLLPSHLPALPLSSLKLPACSLRTRPITQQGAPRASCSIRRNIDECLWMCLRKWLEAYCCCFMSLRCENGSVYYHHC